MKSFQFAFLFVLALFLSVDARVQGDLNGDNIVDQQDFEIFKKRFGAEKKFEDFINFADLYSKVLNQQNLPLEGYGEKDIWLDYRDFDFEAGDGTEKVIPDFSYAGYHYFKKEIPETRLGKFGFRVPVGRLHNVIGEYGAVPNDGFSDSEAIKKAISAVEEDGGGIIYFPPGEYLVVTDEDNRDDGNFHIRKSNIIIQGAGRDKTVIRQVNPLYPQGTAISSSKALFRFGTSTNPGSYVEIVADSNRGTFWITVEDASGFNVGDWVRIFHYPTRENYPTTYRDKVNALWGGDYWNLRAKVRSGEKVEVHEEHSIAEINGDRIRFNEPIRVNIRHESSEQPISTILADGKVWSVRKYHPLEEVAVENLSIFGSFVDQFIHHRCQIDDGGFALIRFSEVVNSWIRNVAVYSANKPIAVGSSAAVSIVHTTVGGNRGHYGLLNSRNHGVFIGFSEDLANVHHGTGMSHCNVGQVVHQFDMYENQSVDVHKTIPSYCSLYDLVNNARLNGSSGTNDPPHHFEYFVFWNLNHGGAGDGGKRPNYNFRTGGTQFVFPWIAGLHGKGATFNEDYIGGYNLLGHTKDNKIISLLDNLGRKVLIEDYKNDAKFEESLFRSQLKLRKRRNPGTVGISINKYFNKLRNEWEDLRHLPVANASITITRPIPTQVFNSTHGERLINLNRHFVDSNNFINVGESSSPFDNNSRVVYFEHDSDLSYEVVSSDTNIVKASVKQVGKKSILSLKTSMIGDAVVTVVSTDGEAVSRYAFNVIVNKYSSGDSTVVYYAKRGSRKEDHGLSRIKRVTLNSSEIDTLVLSQPNEDGNITSLFTDVAVDQQKGLLYFTDAGTSSIFKSNLDGSDLEKIYKGAGIVTPSAIDIDVGNQKIYWTDKGSRSLYEGTSTITGTKLVFNDKKGYTEVVSSSYPIAIKLDHRNRKIYYISKNDNKLRRCNFSGDVVEDIVTNVIDTTNFDGVDIELDVRNNHVYWSDPGNSSIKRANIHRGVNSKVISIITDPEVLEPTGIKLDLSISKIYYLDKHPERQRIRRANLDGTNPRNVVVSEGRARRVVDAIDIELDSANNFVYWTHRSRNEIKRSKIIPLNPPATSRQDYNKRKRFENVGENIGTNPTGLKIANGKIYYVHSGQKLSSIDLAELNLRGVDLQEVNIVQVINNLPRDVISFDFDINVVRNRYNFYFPDRAENVVKLGSLKSKLTYKYTKKLLLDSTPKPTDIKLDISSGKIYYLSSESSIRRCDIDGSNDEHFYSETSDASEAVKIFGFDLKRDKGGHYLFYSTIENRVGKIKKLDLNSKESIVLLDGNKSSSIFWPQRVGIHKNRVFWGDDYHKSLNYISSNYDLTIGGLRYDNVLVSTGQEGLLGFSFHSK